MGAPLIFMALLLFILACALSATSSRASRSYIIPLQHAFLPASMTLLDIRLSAGYCCDLVCSCGEIDDPTTEQCGAMQDRFATLSPSLCASPLAPPHNLSSTTQLCPPSDQAATLCNGGTSCCKESCSRNCTSKLDVCACPCNHCSPCSCCKLVKNRLCRLLCMPCDKVWMMLDFTDQDGKAHTVHFSQNFSFNSTKSHIFYDRYQGISTINGSYKSDDPSIVRVPVRPFILNLTDIHHDFLDFTETYPVASYWAALGAFAAFPVFTVSVILTGLAIALLRQRMRRGRADQRPFRIAWSVNRGLWIGIIWPLIILLLILQVRHLAVRRDTALSMLFSQILMCVGWLPLVLLWLYHIIQPQL